MYMQFQLNDENWSRKFFAFCPKTSEGKPDSTHPLSQVSLSRTHPKPGSRSNDQLQRANNWAVDHNSHQKSKLNGLNGVGSAILHFRLTIPWIILILLIEHFGYHILIAFAVDIPDSFENVSAKVMMIIYVSKEEEKFHVTKLLFFIILYQYSGLMKLILFVRVFLSS